MLRLRRTFQIEKFGLGTVESAKAFNTAGPEIRTCAQFRNAAVHFAGDYLWGFEHGVDRVEQGRAADADGQCFVHQVVLIAMRVKVS
jgi:hypothetical protein